jgi:hypothetical protein
MNTISKISLFLFLSLSIISCEMSGITGDGNVTTENRKTNGKFNKIKVGNGLNIFLSQQDKTSIRVEADSNLQDLIKTEVSDGVLRVYTEDNIGKAASKKVYISTPSLNSLKISSGANLVSKGTFTTTDFELSVSSGASATIAIVSKKIHSSVSSGASLVLSGTTEIFNASASSGANINSFKLQATNAKASASSGASIDLTTTDTLDATASSGANIEYQGNPKHKTISKSSGGSVSKK